MTGKVRSKKVQKKILYVVNRQDIASINTSSNAGKTVDTCEILQILGLMEFSALIQRGGVAVRVEGVEEVAPIGGVCLRHGKLRADSAS